MIQMSNLYKLVESVAETSDTPDTVYYLANITYRLDIILTIMLFVLFLAISGLVVYIMYRFFLRFIPEKGGVKMLGFVPSFADGAEQAISYWTVTDEMISPLYNAINTNLNAAVPYGMAIMGSFIGISIFRRVLFMFF